MGGKQLDPKPDPIKGRRDKVNATFVSLARNRDLWELLTSIRGIEGNLLYYSLSLRARAYVNLLWWGQIDSIRDWDSTMIGFSSMMSHSVKSSKNIPRI